MQDKPKFRMALIVILALATSGLVFWYLKGLQVTPTGESSIAVPAQKITAGTKLTPIMFKEALMPDKYIKAGTVTASSNVADKYAGVDLWPDQMVLQEQLVNAQKSSEMQYKIPAGKRAVTIAIDPISGVAGYLKRGSRVDMIISYKPQPEGKMTQSMTLLQDIEVLAVGSQAIASQSIGEGEATINDNVTLAVSPLQAQQIMLAESTGLIKLTMRPADDKTITPLLVSNHQNLSPSQAKNKE